MGLHGGAASDMHTIGRILGCMWLVCRRSLSETVNKHYVQGCWHAIIASAGDNTTPICNDGVA